MAITARKRCGGHGGDGTRQGVSATREQREGREFEAKGTWKEAEQRGDAEIE